MWFWFVVLVCGCGFHRKIRLTQLWVELSWVVAICIFTLLALEIIYLRMFAYDMSKQYVLSVKCEITMLAQI